MELITKEIEEKFKKYPLGSQDGLLGDSKVLVKYFNPVGVGTWFITEGNKLENGDYKMYGYCHLGDDDMAEFGYVKLSELKEINLPFGMKIERDLYLPEDCTLKEAMESICISIPDYFNKDFLDNIEGTEI